VSVEAIARKWHDQFLNTQAVNHAQAEAAVRAAYRAAGMPEPERFLWCASPLEAAWSALVLIGKDKDYNHAVFEDVERSKSGKARIAEARARVAEQLGIGEDAVEGYLGQAFYRDSGRSPVEKKLNEGIADAWMARAQASDDFLAPHRGGPFKPLHDLEQALHFEGYKGGVGSLFKEALAAAGGKPIAILGGRSAQHRLYGNLAYVEVAIDQALAEAGTFEPSELQRAMWAAYEACGMWWPCHEGVVFAERPVAAEMTPEGPRMIWSDGFTVGGKPSATAATPAPAPIAAAKSPGNAAVLDAELPRDHGQRIAFLRGQASALPYFDRYLAGEHEAVWTELVALGEAVRTDAHAADALAVAYETMHRVGQNVAMLAERLNGMGYRFVEPGSGSGIFGFGKPKAHVPHEPPVPDSAARIAELEQVAGGPIPLSLRAFFDVVGAVNFNGDHGSIAPRDTEGTADPLMVYGVQDAIDCVESGYGEDEDGDRRMYVVAPDALHKANVSGGEAYMIALPAPVADTEVEEEPHGVTFVEYLRIAILGWGGFPGWEQSRAGRPAELDQLKSGLIPF